MKYYSTCDAGFDFTNVFVMSMKSCYYEVKLMTVNIYIKA